MSGEDDELTCSVESQGHVFKLRASGASAVGGGKRGKVAGFSAASRKRLLEKLARLRSDVLPLFITLTYPDLVTCDRARRDLRVWERRIARRFPAAAAVWRLELQKRGAPHFHVLLYGVPFLPVEVIRSTWGAVIGYEGPHTLQVNVRSARSWRGVLAYVAKYIGKPQSSHEMAELVRDQGEAGGAEALLDYPAYLSALLGRVWGVFRAVLLPWAELRRIALRFGSWVYRLKRCARRVFPAIAGVPAGFTLFRESPGQWFDLAEWFAEDSTA